MMFPVAHRDPRIYSEGNEPGEGGWRLPCEASVASLTRTAA
jgi:hypothetical protein